MQSRQGAGFTLIEVMITLSILAILMTLGLPSFSGWIRNLQIRSATEAVLNGIQIAKMEAVRRNTTVGITFDANSGWSVGCTVPSTSCPGTIEQRISQNGTQAARVTPTNLINGAALVFDGSGRVSSGLTAATSPLQLDVSYSTDTCAAGGGSLRCLRILVSRFGQIRMCDPALASSLNDARGC